MIYVEWFTQVEYHFRQFDKPRVKLQESRQDAETLPYSIRIRLYTYFMFRINFCSATDFKMNLDKMLSLFYVHWRNKRLIIYAINHN